MEYCRSAQDDARGWFLLGVARHRSGRLDTALEAFDRAVQLAPIDTQAASTRAVVLDALGKPKEAVDALARALDHSPGQILLLFNHAMMLERSG